MEKIEAIKKYVQEVVLKTLSQKSKSILKTNEELVEKIRRIDEKDITVNPVWCNTLKCDLQVNYTSVGSANGDIRTINHQELLGEVICIIDDEGSDKNLVHNWYKIGMDPKAIRYYADANVEFGTPKFVAKVAKNRAIDAARKYFNRLNMYNSEYDTRVNEYKVIPNEEAKSIFGYKFFIPLKYENSNIRIRGYVFESNDGTFELVFDERGSGTDFYIPESKAYKRKRVLKKFVIIGSIVLAVAIAILILM